MKSSHSVQLCLCVCVYIQVHWMKMVSHMGSAQLPTHLAIVLKDTSPTERRMARASSSSSMEGTGKIEWEKTFTSATRLLLLLCSVIQKVCWDVQVSKHVPQNYKCVLGPLKKMDIHWFHSFTSKIQSKYLRKSSYFCKYCTKKLEKWCNKAKTRSKYFMILNRWEQPVSFYISNF